MEKILGGPAYFASNLPLFDVDEVAAVANRVLGMQTSEDVVVTLAHHWFLDHAATFSQSLALERMQRWSSRPPGPNGELVHILHFLGDEDAFKFFTDHLEIYDAPGPSFPDGETYPTLGHVAANGIGFRFRRKTERPNAALRNSPELGRIIIKILQCIATTGPQLGAAVSSGGAPPPRFLGPFFQTLTGMIFPEPLEAEMRHIAQAMSRSFVSDKSTAASSFRAWRKHLTRDAARSTGSRKAGRRVGRRQTLLEKT
jgi:hypothetical protein